MQHLTIAVLGGDARQAILAQQLRADGHTVAVAALEQYPFPEPPAVLPALPAGLTGLTGLTRLTELTGQPLILLPMPVQKSENILHTPLSPTVCRISDLLDAIPAGARVFGGSIPPPVHAQAAARGLTLTDYLRRDELAIRNAIPTAEGAIAAAMEHTDTVLHGLRALVIGYGRVGAVLAHKLSAFGLQVTAAARTARDRARIEAAGLRAADSRRLADCIAAFPLIFNTVPAPILDAGTAVCLTGGALVIDLASQPGGLAPGAVLPPTVRYVHALGLPGRVAPVSAAQAIRETIYSILSEEELP